MIFDIPILIIATIINILSLILQTATSTSFISLPITAFSNALIFIFQPVYYWKGLMPVDTMLDIIGYTAGFFSALFAFNVVMYLWSKIPWLGKK